MKWFILFISIGIIGGIYGEEISSFFSDIQYPNLHNPTYQEMCTFIYTDTTDSNEYDWNHYTCEDYSRDVTDNARKAGYKSGFVTLYSSPYDHAIVCFETSDMGLYFVEPQLDIIFSEAQMDNMIEQGTYDIDTYYGGPYGAGEYFYFSLSGYSINYLG